jgi:hypothetical protein
VRFSVWTLRRLHGDPSNRKAANMSEPQEPGNGKPRKRVSGKAPARQAAAKVKATIHLSVEASQRLTVHAAMMDMDRSELVEKLINDHLRRYVVSDRGGPDAAASDDVAA